MGVTHPNEQLLRDVLNALMSGDMDSLASLMTEDFVGHAPGSNQLSGDHKSRDEFLDGFFGKIATLTGGQFTFEVEDIIGNDDRVVGLYHVRATRDGNTLEWHQVNVYSVRDGLLADVRMHPHEFEDWNRFWS